MKRWGQRRKIQNPNRPLLSISLALNENSLCSRVPNLHRQPSLTPHNLSQPLICKLICWGNVYYLMDSCAYCHLNTSYHVNWYAKVLWISQGFVLILLLGHTLSWRVIHHVFMYYLKGFFQIMLSKHTLSCNWYAKVLLSSNIFSDCVILTHAYM